MLDRFVYGDVDRISPESPVPVLRVTSERASLGGVGNVAHNVSALGGQVILVAVVGDDAQSREVSTLLSTLSNCQSHLSTDPNRRTTVKTRCIGGNQQIVRIDHDPDLPLDGDTQRDIVQTALKHMPDCDVVVLSDYGKGVLSETTLRQLLRYAKELEKPTVVDPKGPDYSVYAGASVITPNLKELAAASSCAVGTDWEVEQAARRILECFDIGAVVATRSEKGMTVVDRELGCHHIASLARQVYDVSGAGDTVVAVLACGLGGEVDLIKAADLSNLAAGVVVAKLGTAAVSQLELMSAIGSRDHFAHQSKLLTFSRLTASVEDWRRQNRRIGFTNGCFDLLHPGHVKLFSEARNLCDVLIVGVNTDDSVRRLKGPTRPIQDEMSRVTILSSLTQIDALVLFPQDTPIELITMIKPDLLVKGADYRLEQVVGADVVRTYGGEIHLVDLEEGHSTTRLIKDNNI